MNKLIQDFDWQRMILRVTNKVYNKYRSFVDHEEIASAACLGVWQAAMKFDLEKSDIKWFDHFVYKKGCYYTIDILRGDNSIPPRRHVKYRINVLNNYNTGDDCDGSKKNGLNGICDHRFNYKEFKLEWTGGVKGLTDKEKDLFNKRFLDNMTWKSIAATYDVSTSAVSNWAIDLRAKLGVLLLYEMVI